MAVVITIAQQKGGSGKTMLAANLAVCFAASGRVALLDIDPQRSLSRWHALRQHRPGVAALGFSDVSGWRLAAELDRLARGYDLIVVDTPPHIDTDARRAIRGAHLVIIPVQDSAPDLWAAEGTVALAHAEKRPFTLVLNRAPTASKLRDRAVADMAAAGHDSLPATLGNRTSFPRAFAAGLGVTEASPRSPAATEMTALFDAVKARMA